MFDRFEEIDIDGIQLGRIRHVGSVRQLMPAVK